METDHPRQEEPPNSLQATTVCVVTCAGSVERLQDSNPGYLLTGCVIQVKVLNVSVPLRPHLYTRSSKSAFLTVLF